MNIKRGTNKGGVSYRIIPISLVSFALLARISYGRDVAAEEMVWAMGSEQKLERLVRKELARRSR